jgi:hypothetical protein
MGLFILTARNNIPLSGGQMIERGRQIEVYVNNPCALPSNIFVTHYGKEAISRAFAIQGIPATSNYMNMSKWDVKPITPKF